MGCATTYQKSSERSEEIAIELTKTYYTAHGGNLEGLEFLFNKNATLDSRYTEARQILREVWNQLVAAGQSKRVDFVTEFSMMLSNMLSYAREPKE